MVAIDNYDQFWAVTRNNILFVFRLENTGARPVLTLLRRYDRPLTFVLLSPFLHFYTLMSKKMKRIVGPLFLLTPFFLFAQQSPTQTSQKSQKRSIGFGIRAGFNFANVTNASAINGSQKVGF